MSSIAFGGKLNPFFLEKNDGEQVGCKICKWGILTLGICCSIDDQAVGC